MLSYMSKQWKIGRKIYGKRSWRETRRTLLFTVRSVRDKSFYRKLAEYFSNYEPYHQFLEEYVDFMDTLGRVFLFKNSRVNERYNCIITHFDLLKKYLTVEAINSLYSKESKGLLLWENDEIDMKAFIKFDVGQRKEGFLTLFVMYEENKLYNVNFRFTKGYDGEDAIVIGTIQGAVDGLANTKVVTKKMFGYRPKNLAVFFIRQFAKSIGIHYLYAVSDEGFYANSHMIRFNRSKSVYFDDFFKELGGIICKEDSRFFRIPLEEVRKTYETAKTHKRNLYRKRYALLDEIIVEVEKRIAVYKKINAKSGLD